LTGLDFNFVKQGNSKKNQTTEVPQPNQIKVYEFNLSDFGKPEKVTVAPITVSGVGAVSSESSAINEYGGSSDCIPNCEGKLCGDSNGCGDFCVVNPCSICRYINEETGLCFDWAWYNGVCQGLGSSASCVECIVDLDCPNNGLTNPNCATRSCKEDNTCTPEACGDPIETPYGADVGEACSLDEDCLPWLFCSPSNICAE
jgi:hypothetical protein